MIKKIPCKVVNSEPLRNSREVFLHISKLNEGHKRVDNTVNRGPQVNHSCNLFTYSHSSELVKESVNDGLIGQLLDCYV